MISPHWIRWLLGSVRQQAITRANVEPNLCWHMVPPGKRCKVQKLNLYKLILGTLGYHKTLDLCAKGEINVIGVEGVPVGHQMDMPGDLINVLRLHVDTWNTNAKNIKQIFPIMYLHICVILVMICKHFKSVPSSIYWVQGNCQYAIFLV